jgi:hypothetical protein
VDKEIKKGASFQREKNQRLQEGARKLLQAAIENEVIDYIQFHAGPEEIAEARGASARGQNPFAVIVGCSDSRVGPEARITVLNFSIKTSPYPRTLVPNRETAGRSAVARGSKAVKTLPSDDCRRAIPKLEWYRLREQPNCCKC